MDAKAAIAGGGGVSEFVRIDCPLGCGWWQIRYADKAEQAIADHIALRHPEPQPSPEVGA